MPPRRGDKTPTLRIARDYSESRGRFACELMRALGEPPDEAETAILEDWLAVDADGKYVHTRSFLACPRQNLKTWDIKARMIYGVCMAGERILYTVHNGDTATEVRELMLDYFGRRKGDPKAQFPWLNRRVKRVNMRTGHESIYFENGGCIYFSTRTDNMKLGFTVDVVVFDEAQRLKESHLSAIMSTAAAAPLKNPQYIFCGTPPEPTNPADVFQVKMQEIVDGEAEDDATLSRWSANDLEGFVPSDGFVADPDTWYRCNPALGDRINESTVRAELGTYTDPLTFAQQRLCYFLPKAEAQGFLFTEEAWDRLEVEARPAKADKTAVGIRFLPDGSSVAVAFCDLVGDSAHVGLIRQKSTADGIDWLVDMAAKHADTVALYLVDGKNDVADFVHRLVDAGVSSKAVRGARVGDVLGAAGMLVNAINEGRLEHLEDAALKKAVTSVVKRKIGAGFGFGGTESPEVVEACALALYAAKTTKRDPRRKARVW